MLGGRKSEAPVIRGSEIGRTFAQAEQTFKHSSTRVTEFAEFGEVFDEKPLLRALRASAVQSPSPCTELGLATLATGKPEEPLQ